MLMSYNFFSQVLLFLFAKVYLKYAQEFTGKHKIDKKWKKIKESLGTSRVENYSI